jgi:hypothetical protein
MRIGLPPYGSARGIRHFVNQRPGVAEGVPMKKLASILLNCLVAMMVTAAPALADETDQFTLPDRDQFIDMGDYLALVHYRVLEKVVSDANERIASVKKTVSSDAWRARRLNDLHSPVTLADAIRGAFGPGFFEMRSLEAALRSSSARRLDPDRFCAYRAGDWVYSGSHLPIDPRNLVLLFQSSTLKAYGVHFGVDKIGHFHDLGHIYYKDWVAAVRGGTDPDEAAASVVKFYARGPISEGAAIGNFATGVYSNGDLAANYLGFKFYRNLSEPVMLEGTEHPPLIVRHGDFWRLNDHVRPDSDYFRPFISAHMNEALNPCVYEWGMRDPIRDHLREHSEQILAFYADDLGRPRPREWFEKKAQELSTYHGEDYGHSGMSDGMITIAQACFPPVEDSRPDRTAAPE